MPTTATRQRPHGLFLRFATASFIAREGAVTPARRGRAISLGVPLAHRVAPTPAGGRSAGPRAGSLIGRSGERNPGSPQKLDRRSWCAPWRQWASAVGRRLGWRTHVRGALRVAKHGCGEGGSQPWGGWVSHPPEAAIEICTYYAAPTIGHPPFRRIDPAARSEARDAHSTARVTRAQDCAPDYRTTRCFQIWPHTSAALRAGSGKSLRCRPAPAAEPRRGPSSAHARA